MSERPRFFDDLAGVAGGAFSALAGLREEIESVVRARVDEATRKFDLVKREDLEAVQEMAASARAGQEAADARIAALEAKLASMTQAGTQASASPIPPASPAAETSGRQPPPAAMPSAGEGGAPIPPPVME